MAQMKLAASLRGLLTRQASVVCRRNLAASSACANAGDPVQNLFLNKLAEYKAKAEVAGEGALVDSTPEIQQEVQAEIDNLNRRYGGGDMEEFPTFSFEQ